MREAGGTRGASKHTLPSRQLLAYLLGQLLEGARIAEKIFQVYRHPLMIHTYYKMSCINCI